MQHLQDLVGELFRCRCLKAPGRGRHFGSHRASRQQVTGGRGIVFDQAEIRHRAERIAVGGGAARISRISPHLRRGVVQRVRTERVVPVIDSSQRPQIDENEAAFGAEEAVPWFDVPVQHRVAGGTGDRVQRIDRFRQITDISEPSRQVGCSGSDVLVQ